MLDAFVPCKTNSAVFFLALPVMGLEFRNEIDDVVHYHPANGEGDEKNIE